MPLHEQICPQQARAELPRLLLVTTVAPTLRAFLLPYARHFRGLSWRVDALTGSLPVADADVRKAFDSVHTVMWTRHPLRTLTTIPSCCRQIRALVRENRHDIVHVHTPIASFVTRFALRKVRRERGTRVVYTAHGFHFHPFGNLLTNWFWLCLEKLAGRWTDALIVINREDFDAARQHWIVTGNKLHRLPGIGIDLDHWKRDHVSYKELADMRKALNIKTDTPVLLCVGDLIPRKRHADLLRGFSEFLMPRREVTPEIRPVLIFAGDGPLRIILEALARKLGIAEQVRFAGFQNDLRTFYTLADVTVMVSLQEGLPRSLMESLAMGTPVIATDVRGNHELVDETCGFLVPPRNSQALANAMRWMFDMTAEQRRELGRRGRERMAEYSIARCLAMTEAIYAKLLECGDLAQKGLECGNERKPFGVRRPGAALMRVPRHA